MVVYHKQPKGFRYFTDYKGGKESLGKGYVTKVGKNPYTKSGSKVLFYKRVRRPTVRRSSFGGFRI